MLFNNLIDIIKGINFYILTYANQVIKLDLIKISVFTFESFDDVICDNPTSIYNYLSLKRHSGVNFIILAQTINTSKNTKTI